MYAGNPNINYLVAEKLPGKTKDDVQHKKKISNTTKVTSTKGRTREALAELEACINEKDRKE